MGSGASNLNKVQVNVLTRTLREKYEELKASGMAEDEIRERLTHEHASMMETFQFSTIHIDYQHLDDGSSKKSTPHPAIPHYAKPTAALLSKGKNPGTPTPARKSRRRSFDGQPMRRKSIKASASVEALQKVVEDAPVIESKQSSDQVDSWDSVTQQPFCNLCQMAFKSMSLLDRHQKYSQLHIKNERREAGEDLEELHQEVQIEGVHYKLLYSGTKLYWRTNATVDVHLYLHELPRVIEAITFDMSKFEEITRLYLDHTLISDYLTKTGRVEEELHQMLVDESEEYRFTIMSDEAGLKVLREEIHHKLVVRFVVQRLQLTSENPELAKIAISGGKHRMEFAKLAGDDYDRSPLLVQKPKIVVPVQVSRRRKSSAEEIGEGLQTLSKEHELVAGALDEVEKALKATEESMHAALLARHVYNLAAYMRGKKWYTDLSRPLHKKWVLAIRRVIRMNLVKKTKKVLSERQQNKQQEG